MMAERSDVDRRFLGTIRFECACERESESVVWFHELELLMSRARVT